jgi:hypothetical protein
MLSYKKINKIINIKFFNLYIYVYMLSQNLYKNKYLKYKNKYLNLKSQVGGAPINNDYITNLIKCLNYTRSIFHYLDKFYMLPDVNVILISSIKQILNDLIFTLIQNLTSYRNHLNNVHTVFVKKKVLQEFSLEPIVDPVDLKTIDALKTLDEIKPTNQYYKEYWEMLRGVDDTKILINGLLIKEKNVQLFEETLGNIKFNINLLIEELNKELKKMNLDRTIIEKGQRLVYKTIEEEEEEEQLRAKAQLASSRKPSHLYRNTGLFVDTKQNFSDNLENR